MQNLVDVKTANTFGAAFFAVLMAVLLLPGAALAQGNEGCDPATRDAQQKKAQAVVAADVAVTEQIVVKPDSVLALTCFNGAAGGSAARGANFFSGSFVDNTVFKSIIETMLTGFLGQFADAEGFEAGTVDYTGTVVADNPSCTGVQDIWTTIVEKGLTPGVVLPTITDLASGTLPAGVGTKFQDNWETAGADGIFESLQAAIEALPVPAIPDFSGADSTCAVLNAAGYTITCP